MLYFIRHGQSQYNVGLTDKFNSEITEKGQEQAVAVSFKLAKLLNSCVGFVSPYKRCLQTALYVHQYTGVKFTVNPLIGESPEEVHKNMDCRIYRENYPGFIIHLHRIWYVITQESQKKRTGIVFCNMLSFSRVARMML